MCNKHSFVMDKEGKIYNGHGIIESHTTICHVHNLNEDRVNKYEYNYNNCSCDHGIENLIIDSEVFEVKSLHVKVIENYISKLFPNKQSFDTYENLIVDEKLLEKLSEDSDENVRRVVAENENCTAEILNKLSGDSDENVRRVVEENENCTAEILNKLSGDSSWSIRRAVARNENCTVEILEKLSGDSDWHVRCAVARMYN